MSGATRGRLHAARTALLGQLGSWLLRLLGATWRVTTEGPDPLCPNHAPVVAAFWHRNVLIAAHHYRDRGFTSAVSRSRDGDLIAALLTALGYSSPPRGSSTRGGAAALHALVRLVSAGTTVSVQTDGPRGPARVSKSGVVTLARLTGCSIAPVAFGASRGMRFRSWDRTLLPAPFAQIVCRYGDAIPMPPEEGDDRDEEIRLQLDRELNRMTDEIDARF